MPTPLRRLVPCLLVFALLGASIAPALAQPQAAEILSQGPFEPRDKDLFDIYPESTEAEFAPDPGWTEQERVANITAQFEARIAMLDAETQARALANFEQASETMDVRNAAAIAIWTGRSDATVDFYLNSGQVSKVVNGRTTNPDANAESIPQSDGTIRVIINENLQHEDLLLVAPGMLHEPIHQDVSTGRSEEAVAHLMHNLYFMDLLADLPEIAQQKTALSQNVMRDVLGIVFNSNTMIEGRGELFPGARRPEVDNYFEDANFLKSVPDFRSNANDYFRQLLQGLGMTDTEDIAFFNKDLIDALDIDELIDLEGGLTTEELLRAAEALSIAVDPSPTTLAVAGSGRVAFDSKGLGINFGDGTGMGDVTVSRIESRPSSPDGITEANVSAYRVVIAAPDLAVGTGTAVHFDADGFRGISDPAGVTVYARAAPGTGPFSALPTRYDAASDEIVADVTSFSEFVFASDTDPLPVELAAFAATADGADVLLEWTSASETNNAGFEVQVKSNPGGPFARHGFVEGRGTTTEAQHYRYRAADLTPGQYVFRLKQVDFDGRFALSAEVEVTIEMAEAFALSAAQPNPFSQRADFTVTVQRAQQVQVAAYNVLGQRVAALFEGRLGAGEARTLTFEAAGLASGIYFVRAEGEDFTRVRRATLVR